MISPDQLQAVAAATYAVVSVVFLVRMRDVAPRLRRYYYPLVGVVGFAGVATALDLVGVGTRAVGESVLSVPIVAEGMVAYGVLWGTCGWLADVDRRLLAPVVAIPVVLASTYHVAVAIGPPAAMVGAVVVVVGFLVVGGLFLGPIWSAARDVPRARRLLHWKCRNLLLFQTAVLVTFAATTVVVSLTPFVDAFLRLYIEMIIRVGIAGFLFANLDALEEDPYLGVDRGGGDGSTVEPDASPG